MGSNLTKENQATWEQETVEKWKLKAVDILKSYYLSFRGSQFDEYILNNDENLLLAKICFAIYGPPTVEDAEEIWDGYDDNQRENAKEILKIILDLHKKKKPQAKQILVAIIFIACKQDDTEYILPIFSIFTGHDPYNPHASRAYVDTQKRTYTSWDDWKSNNTMPMLKYAYPRRGFFTSSPNHNYEFDEDQIPDIEFGFPPICSTKSRILGTTDTITGITALGCGVIGLASMFTPIGPSVLVASMYGGISSALYGSSRAAVRLRDKGTHGESLTDIESLALMFSIIATPLHFTTSIVNAQLVRGAVVNGRIFSSSMRMFATVLNFSTLGVDGVMLAFGIANLIDKAKQDQLKPLDILQLSMSVFFFTNTLIRPQMASSIIKNAQETHIQSYANNLSDTDAKASFDRFLDSNRGDGSIKDTSKIIRTINRINDPNKLFGDLKGSTDIKIGGRKGKTLLIQQDKNVQRINPSKGASKTSIQPVNTVGCSGLINEDKDDNRDKPFDNDETNTSVISDTVSGISNPAKVIATLASPLLAPYLKKIEEKISSTDIREVIEVLYDKISKEFPNLSNEIQHAVNTLLRLHHHHHHETTETPINFSTNQSEEEEELLNLDDTEFDPQEFVNIETKHILGGLSMDIMHMKNLNPLYEVNYAPPRNFWTGTALNIPKNELAFLMHQNDHKVYQSTGREGILLLMNDLTTTMKMEITFLNACKLLPKYSVSVLQWIEKAFENQQIRKEEFLEILEHFHNVLETSEKTVHYEFNGIELSDEELQIFFYRFKACILLKIFVIKLTIGKNN